MAGLLFGAGMTDDGGYVTSDRSEASAEGLDSPVEGELVEGFGVIDCSTLENPDMPPPTREYVPTVQRILEESPLESRDVFQPDTDWSNDILVWGGRAGTGQDFDIDENTGDLYACFDTDHATGDSLLVYRSQDGGITWSLFGIGANSTGEISNPKIRIVQNASGESQVLMMGIWTGSSYDDDLYTRWWDTGGGGGTWALVDSNVDWADLDADVGSGGYAHCVYSPNDTGTEDIYYARNNVAGGAWVLNTNYVYNCMVENYPAIAAGDNGVVAVVYVDDRISDLEVRAKMSTDYGTNWSGSVEVSFLTYTPEYPDVSFARGSNSDTGWIITQSVGATDDWLGYYYTTDTGSSWTFGSNFNPTDDENLPSMRARKMNGDVTVSFHGSPGYETYFTWAQPSSPTSFSTPEVINDFESTGFWPACAGWNGSYSAIMYANWDNNYRIMFDWYGNTGIEGDPQGPLAISSAPNPFSAVTNISFNLASAGPVDIAVYDVTGRLVSSLADGQSFGEGTNTVQWDGTTFSGTQASPGVYFCRLTADGTSLTQRMLLVK
ncbi:MAG: hypothetical protein AVO35_05915 [Candidatus Aegiribacteria sp. MLS_C]|nr:MAG: hypothetical protein AVO35_05915 [Candidatus Aegiribacteria sp. MLS_C]